jgi:acyl-CoA synthetase (AMP-forming)/AMP-acid ligase II
LPGFELRLAPGPEADLGELELRGPAVTPGYFRPSRETEGAFTPDGWLRTGDLAMLADGYLTIAGRAKELVNVGGFNVFPGEVEAVLLEHPDVAQAAVVGVPDERMGEALRAFVVPRAGAAPTPAMLLGFARERIAGYKLPYALELVAELPLLASGKPDRRALARSARAGGPAR